MQKMTLSVFPLLLLILTACSGQIPASVQATSTPDLDPCASQNIPATVQAINELMREFDRVSVQLTSAPAEQFPGMIADLQRIRRAAEDLPVPVCLETLKKHQLNHMNRVIQTLIGFIGSGDQEALRTGFEIAQEQYQQYSFELVRLLGITLATVTASP